MHMSVHIHMHMHMDMHMHMNVHAYPYACMHTYMHAHVYDIHMRMHMHACACIHASDCPPGRRGLGEGRLFVPLPNIIEFGLQAKASTIYVGFITLSGPRDCIRKTEK